MGTVRGRVEGWCGHCKGLCGEVVRTTISNSSEGGVDTVRGCVEGRCRHCQRQCGGVVWTLKGAVCRDGVDIERGCVDIIEVFSQLWLLSALCIIVSHVIRLMLSSALSSFLSRTDSISISIWNYKKVHKRQGAGFLGCVRLSATMISRIKDSGCE